jgi:hypothetical protein
MWKELESGEIELKMIDWDAAHFSTESLYDEAHKRLNRVSVLEFAVEL